MQNVLTYQQHDLSGAPTRGGSCIRDMEVETPVAQKLASGVGGLRSYMEGCQHRENPHLVASLLNYVFDMAHPFFKVRELGLTFGGQLVLRTASKENLL